MKTPPGRCPMTQARMVVAVLMAGGSGTRLWPLSREQHPKQFLSLLGKSSLFQETALRTSRIEEAISPIVIGSVAHRFLIAEQLRQAEIRDAAVLLEPEGRNRSEEHTSELQSLMRISYAVFCLKKKHTTQLTYSKR